jgi:hypothetical protein
MKQYEVVDYDIITSKSIELHKATVREMFDKGWSFEGHLIINSKGFFIQAFSKPKRAALR